MEELRQLISTVSSNAKRVVVHLKGALISRFCTSSPFFINFSNLLLLYESPCCLGSSMRSLLFLFVETQVSKTGGAIGKSWFLKLHILLGWCPGRPDIRDSIEVRSSRTPTPNPLIFRALTDGALHARHAQVITDKLPSPLTFQPLRGGACSRTPIRPLPYVNWPAEPFPGVHACSMGSRDNLENRRGLRISLRIDLVFSGWFNHALLPAGSRYLLAVASLIRFFFFFSIAG
jgi:hypothetical protein